MLLWLLACYVEVDEKLAERYDDNPFHDYDQDGLLDNEDCDDTNPDIGQERKFYLDADGDGFGSENRSLLVCPNEVPQGYVPPKEDNPIGSFDCDDSDDTVYPGAQEVCDEVDNDCNGEVDDYSGLNAPIWFADADGDGFGYFDHSIQTCNAPPNYVEGYGDCDDTDALIHPWVEGLEGGIELCDEEGKDENCNGIINEDSAADAEVWYQDSDGDGFGANFIIRYACEQPEGFISTSGDCNDQDASISPDISEVCNNVDDDCDGNIDEGFNGTAPIGSTIFYADSDGDGYGDSTFPWFQCVEPNGFVSNSDDCNDTNASISPDADEYCNNIDDNCDGDVDEESALDKSTFYADTDSDGYGDATVTQEACPSNQPDGYVFDNSDCDDNDPAQYPGADEYCNGEDDDCNGVFDENDALDTNTYYFDGDNDGYGHSLITIQSCSGVNGFVSNDGDCNDSSASIRPLATEYCNNIDDNCDGSIDNSAVDATEYYIDGDNDGHGALVDIQTGYDQLSCPNFDAQTGLPIAPAGFSETNDDCDDSNAGINPLMPELCTLTIDENCDGHMIAGATDVTTYYADSDGDGFGNSLYILEVCTEPLGYIEYQAGDLIDCNDNDAEVYPYTLDSSDPNWVDEELCNGKLDRCDNAWNGMDPPEDELDDDGDGYVECELESSFLLNPDGTVNGWENPNQIILGGLDCNDIDETEHPNAIELCNGVFDNCTHPMIGVTSAPVEELDDDGDFYVECEGYSASTWEGDVSVVGGLDCNDNRAVTKPGGAPLTDPEACLTDLDGDGFADRSWGFCPQERDFEEARYRFLGEASYDYAGYTLDGAGDIDGDGKDDIIIGAFGSDHNGPHAGKVYILLGDSLGASDISLAQSDHVLLGEVSTYAGWSVSRAGDVDGDGLGDLLFAAPYVGDGGEQAGKVYLMLGSSLTSGTPSSVLDSDYFFIGEAEFDHLREVSNIGDIDGDGLDDILMAAPDNDDGGENAGKAYLFLGASLGTDATMSASTADYTLVGENPDDQLGDILAPAGDVDGDGLGDFLLTSPTNDDGGENAGKVYLFLGSSFVSGYSLDLSQADHVFIGENSWDELGASISSAGDIDGDGLDDILIGAPGNDDGALTSGKAYLILGSSMLGGSGVFDLSNSDYTFVGSTPSLELGVVSGAGDVDGDGLDDFLVGVPNQYYPALGSSAGVSYLFFGSSMGGSTDVDLSTADYVFWGSENSDGVNSRLEEVGDIDGDGLDDILIGASGNDDLGVDNGKVVLFSACE